MYDHHEGGHNFSDYDYICYRCGLSLKEYQMHKTPCVDATKPQPAMQPKIPPGISTTFPITYTNHAGEQLEKYTLKELEAWQAYWKDNWKGGGGGVLGTAILDMDTEIYTIPNSPKYIINKHKTGPIFVYERIRIEAVYTFKVPDLLTELIGDTAGIGQLISSVNLQPIRIGDRLYPRSVLRLIEITPPHEWRFVFEFLVLPTPDHDASVIDFEEFFPQDP